MSSIDARYWAGFFDGEGCVLIASARGRSFYLKVEISNTNYSILCAAKKAFGGCVIQRKFTPTRRTAWQWSVAASQAVNFLKVIYPYLRVKRDQTKIGLSFASLFHGSLVYRGGSRPLSVAEINRRRKYMIKLQESKKKQVFMRKVA